MKAARDADERGAAGNDLGLALWKLGERESGTGKLEEAVAAYREALKEWTRERVPLDWAKTQQNLGVALETLGERESGTGKLEEAVAAYREALTERTRERVPLDWAMAQINLGNALQTAYGEALEERTRDRVPLDWAESFGGQGVAMMLIAIRTNEGGLAEAALRQIQTASETARLGGDEQMSAHFQQVLTAAQAFRDRLKGQ